MFRFNFSEKDEEPKPVDEQFKDESPETIKESKKLEVTADQYAEFVELLKSAKVNCFVSGETEIGYLDNTSLTNEVDTDLIPSIYEGGFKIWECTQDLADLFTSSDELNEFEGKTVCDLGCSAGVLGIVGLINNATKVDFQDFVSFSHLYKTSKSFFSVLFYRMKTFWRNSQFQMLF